MLLELIALTKDHVSDAGPPPAPELPSGPARPPWGGAAVSLFVRQLAPERKRPNAQNAATPDNHNTVL
jgi:hypothetical protein